ncbi:MAG: DUF3035 domain-containing protein [Rhodospirillales bacterium]|nr:DUF3035 domain-containing protein [Rhodospirillales bacterium]MCW8861803.1 DUF3035 domain-containing protein [Rhodospirillales bacterium]MCW8951466.1 DUF3035 domain-containing protein [Rhodospirillales bacterium]
MNGNCRRRITTVFAGLFALTLLSGCDTAKEQLGLTKKAPDEFTVYRRAPLSLPPAYDLRPPEPGAVGPAREDPRLQAKNALTGGRTADQVKDKSMGEYALLKSAGALDVDPGIRQQVNRETSIYAEESETFTEKMMFWSDKNPYGTIVDADKESQRIRENQALGDPLTKGETPKIERKSKALLEGLFK